MITTDTGFRDFVAASEAAGVCGEGLAFLKQSASYTADTPLGTAVLTDGLVGDMQAFWTLQNVGHLMTPELRMLFIQKLEAPRTALHILMACKFLTDEEKRELEKKFDGKFAFFKKDKMDGKVAEV